MFFQQIGHRINSARRIDDGRRPSVKHLNNVWLLTRAERSNACCHRVFVAALIDGGQLHVALAGVEFCCDLINHFTKAPAHGVPESDFRWLCLGAARQAHNRCHCCGKQTTASHPLSLLKKVAGRNFIFRADGFRTPPNSFRMEQRPFKGVRRHFHVAIVTATLILYCRNMVRHVQAHRTSGLVNPCATWEPCRKNF